jgi:pimeloyl-ACP methyl ester carboxylesterase
MQRYERDGVTVAYRVEGKGPRLMFLHNGGASSTIWRHQVRDLSGDFETVTLDFPGFGAAPRPRTAVDRGAHVELIAGLLEELGNRDGSSRSVLVGNCMGANIAAGVALARPELVAGLVLVNPLTETTFDRGWLGPLHQLRRRVPVFGSVLRAGARVILPEPGAVGALRFQLGAKGRVRGLQHDPELVAAYRRRDQLPALLDVLDDLAAYGWLDKLAGDAPVPVCTVWGAENRVLSPKAGSDLAARLGVEERHVLDGCGHLPMLEDPVAFTAIVARFARSRLEGAASTERTFP